MRPFGFIISLCHKNKFLAHNELKLKRQGGDTEPLTKAESTRILGKELDENETWKKEKENYEGKEARRSSQKSRRVELNKLCKMVWQQV